jgi:hypothetical protein
VAVGGIEVGGFDGVIGEIAWDEEIDVAGAKLLFVQLPERVAEGSPDAIKLFDEDAADHVG